MPPDSGNWSNSWQLTSKNGHPSLLRGVQENCTELLEYLQHRNLAVNFRLPDPLPQYLQLRMDYTNRLYVGYGYLKSSRY